MKVLSPASLRKDARPDGFPRLLMAGAAMALLVMALRPCPSNPARAGEQGPAQEKSQVPGRAFHPDFVAKHELMLAGFDRRLIALTNLVLQDTDSAQRTQNQVVDFTIQEKRAEADYTNAKLTREVAEIVVREYVEGVSVQDLASVEGEISLAKSEVERAKRNTAEAKERLARITAVADNSAFGLNIVYTYTDRLIAAENLERTTAFTVEQAESKKKVLVQYTRLKTIKELTSEVMKAKSDELAKQATWELKKGMIEVARKEGQGKGLPEDRKRILALLDQAIPLEEQIRAKLVEVGKVEQLPDSMSNEIGRLTNELSAVVDRAESLRDAGDFARLKPRIQRAALRYKVSIAK